MKILCTKSEYTKFISHCTINDVEDACDKCILRLVSNGDLSDCSTEFLESICEIVPESGEK